jgi:uncharacterized protein YdaU (DUF1376 family)
MKSPPAFQFYPSDFLGDPSVMAMSLDERGAYITLLCVAWMEGGIPSEPSALRRLLRVSPKQFDRIWEAVKPCWRRGRKGRLVSPRMEQVRSEHRDFSRKAKAAADLRWERERQRKAGHANA